MKNKLWISLVCCFQFLMGCTTKETECVEIETLYFCDENLQFIESEKMMEGVRKHYSLKNVQLDFVKSYYSNNLYEYDVPVVPPYDSNRMKRYKESNVEFIVSENKRDVDLDYIRKYNVFFDTINNIGIKWLRPRVSFKYPYYCFISEIPSTYKKNIGYASLTVKFENINSEDDELLINNLIKSLNVKDSLSK